MQPSLCIRLFRNCVDWCMIRPLILLSVVSESQYTGRVLAVLMVSLVSYCYFAYWLAIGRLADMGESMEWLLTKLLVGHAILGLFAWSYVAAVRSTSFVPDDKVDVEAARGRFCRKCNRPKPPRAHHCRTCKTCVLRMDHHCPWINNCVGENNHKFFMLFLFYLACLCIYMPFTVRRAFVQALRTAASDTAATHILYAVVLATCLAVALLLFIGFHLFLVSTARTTIEFFKGPERDERTGQPLPNPHDHGFRSNIRAVMGRHWILLPFPPDASERVS
eukprot:tig00000135_g7971.t1